MAEPYIAIIFSFKNIDLQYNVYDSSKMVVLLFNCIVSLIPHSYVLHADKDSLSEEVKEELALQMMGIGKLMSSYPEYNSEAAYDVLCKVYICTCSALVCIVINQKTSRI